MLFGRKKKQAVAAYDKRGKVPVIRSSICTGEQVAGFKDIHTGKFTEVMAVRNHRDLDEFLMKYGISKELIRKEW